MKCGAICRSQIRPSERGRIPGGLPTRKAGNFTSNGKLNNFGCSCQNIFRTFTLYVIILTGQIYVNEISTQVATSQISVPCNLNEKNKKYMYIYIYIYISCFVGATSNSLIFTESPQTTQLVFTLTPDQTWLFSIGSCLPIDDPGSLSAHFPLSGARSLITQL